jgi:DNA end-binding protein Ku
VNDHKSNFREALKELVDAKLSGKTIGPTHRPRADNVVNLMDALRQSIASDTSKKPKKPRKAGKIAKAKSSQRLAGGRFLLRMPSSCAD